MKLWELRPINRTGEETPMGGQKPDPWDPWYDRAFGFVVRAETAEDARRIIMRDFASA